MSNFWDLINIEEFEKRDNFEENRWEISFYCKDCKKMTTVEKCGTVKFKCKTCSSKNVVIGLKKSLEKFYHINS